MADGLVSLEARHERLLELTGAVDSDGSLIRRAGLRVHECVAAQPDPWSQHRASGSAAYRLLGAADVRVVPLRLRSDWLSAYPTDRNNGALWSGRGLSTALSGGAWLRWGPFSASVAPLVAFQQNAAFDTAAIPAAAIDEGVSGFSYPFGRVDFPQRFGDESFWTLDPGSSFARLDAFGAAAGVSTENLWWGPGQRNSILMGSSAAGVPHVFLGTSGPRRTPIGSIEAEAVWGRMAESEYFDTIAANDDRLLTGMVLSYAPRFLPGLTLGVARVYYQTIPPEGLDFEDYIPFLESPLKETLADSASPDGNDAADQLGAVYARWVLPESDFEVYAELARNDHSWDFHDWLVEPDHSQAYTLGFTKALGSADRLFRLTGELTHLQKPITTLHRASPSYYRHAIVRQGYTNDGQLMGAWIGPGSDNQFLGLDVFERWGSAGLFVERVRHDADAYFQIDSIRGKFPWRHDVELGFGAQGVLFVREVTLEGTLASYERRSRYFAEGRRERNWMLLLEGSWSPR